ncbi:hypothetical protein CASFOL_035116 [Castilleja foliolosa]|uniref:indole-3-pyruvate monooxygenase n=1 Tax=Castilleja foliolosa TaxID=1961234 RepID=A0ABD3BSF6_9LAMI
MGEITSVIIVGGGPSGLSTAAYLHHLSIPYTLLEREDCFASLWQKYTYDRVHLHLAKRFSQLPLMPIPSNYPTYLSRTLFLRYLNDYVSHFEIAPKYARKVEMASFDGLEWEVGVRNLDSGDFEVYRSRFLVVATGDACDVSIPEVDGLGSFPGEFMPVQEWQEIALDLANCGAKTSIVVRSSMHVISRGMAYAGLVLLKYLPLNWVDSIVTMMSKVVYGDLTKYGIQRPEEGPFALKVKSGKYPVIDCGTLHKIKSGEVQVLPAGIKSINGSEVCFENGKEYPFEVIIFATGFKRSTKEWLRSDDDLLNDDGFPKKTFPADHWKGGENGVYFVGLARRGLYGAAMDAQNIAHHINNLISYT